jgi:signal peptidase I
MSAGEQDSAGSRGAPADAATRRIGGAATRQVGEAGDRRVGDAAGTPPRRTVPSRRRHAAARGGRGSFARELPVLVLIAFVLALLIKTFLVQAFWIPSESMEQTLLIDDRVLVNKVVYQFRDVHRGEVVVFNGEGTTFESRLDFVEQPSNLVVRAVRGLQDLLGLGAPSEKDFIKRVIGVGGDTVACCDPQGRVTVNGKSLDEPYVYENNDIDQRSFGPVTVPKGQLWLMGDHRSDSSDSRAHGPVPEDKVIGRAFVKVWPLSRFGLLQAPEGTFGGIPAPTGGFALVLTPMVMRRRRHGTGPPRLWRTQAGGR